MTQKRLLEIRGEIDQRAANATALTQLIDWLIEVAPKGAELPEETKEEIED